MNQAERAARQRETHNAEEQAMIRDHKRATAELRQRKSEHLQRQVTYEEEAYRFQAQQRQVKEKLRALAVSDTGVSSSIHRYVTHEPYRSWLMAR